MPRKLTSLGAVVLQIRSKPPKKFSPSLITDVYSKLNSSHCLDDLIIADYFQLVAWKFFHADITNSHLEVLLQIVTYEQEVLHQSSCWSSMIQESEKLHQLILRILQSTLSHKDSNSRLATSIFLFLGAMLKYDALLLLQHRLYESWSATVFSHFAELTKETSFTRPFLDVLEAFLSFCLSASVNCDVLASRFKATSLPLCFRNHELGPKVERLANLLIYCLYSKEWSKDNFTRFQLILSQKTHGFERFIMAALRLDISRLELEESLGNIPASTIREIAEALDLKHSDVSDSLLPSVICQFALGVPISYQELVECKTFSEIDIFDIHEPNSSVFYFPAITLPMKFDFLQSELIRTCFVSLQDAYSHISSVFRRVTGVNDDGIECSSKYFSRVENIKVSGCRAKLSLTSPLTIKTGSSLVLLELQKPNRFSDVTRMIKFGVNAARIARVAEGSESPVIFWHSPGFEDRFNAVICLPDSILFESCLSDLTNVPDPLQTSQVYLKQSLVLDGVDYDLLKDMEGLLGVKKRKLDDGSQESYFTYHDSTVSLRNGSSLSGIRSKALLTMLSSKRLVIHSELGHLDPAMINCFLQALKSNGGDETCLVVLPSAEAVDAFRVIEGVSGETCKLGSSSLLVHLVFAAVDGLLRQVTTLSERLGLSEYDFGSSIRHALMLYDSHVEPKWTAYLNQLTKDESSIARYPFCSFDESDTSSEQQVMRVAEHFQSVKKLFAELQSFLPLDKLRTGELTSEQIEDIRHFAARKAQYVISSADSIDVDYGAFSNIILPSNLTLPALKGSDLLKRVIYFGASSLPVDTPLAQISVASREEIASLLNETSEPDEEFTAYNPGFKFITQQIAVPSSAEHINVAEGRYCVYLYQYMRLLGYPHGLIQIAYASPFMKHLLEEVLREQNIHPQDIASDTKNFIFGWPILLSIDSTVPTEYLIASIHGAERVRQLAAFALCATKGFYLVGAKTTLPYKLHCGEFEVCVGEYYGKDSRSNMAPYAIEGPDHMAEYVANMTTTRMSGERNGK